MRSTLMLLVVGSKVNNLVTTFYYTPLRTTYCPVKVAPTPQLNTKHICDFPPLLSFAKMPPCHNQVPGRQTYHATHLVVYYF